MTCQDYRELYMGSYFKDKDDEYDIKITDRPGHAIEILRDYDYNEECNVYSIGGDGTLNEVVTGDKNEKVNLYRPFAQLNIGTTDGDLLNATKYFFFII